MSSQCVDHNSYLLWRYIEGQSAQVNLGVVFDAGQYEEYTCDGTIAARQLNKVRNVIDTMHATVLAPKACALVTVNVSVSRSLLFRGYYDITRLDKQQTVLIELAIDFSCLL